MLVKCHLYIVRKKTMEFFYSEFVFLCFCLFSIENYCQQAEENFRKRNFKLIQHLSDSLGVTSVVYLSGYQNLYNSVEILKELRNRTLMISFQEKNENKSLSYDKTQTLIFCSEGYCDHEKVLLSKPLCQLMISFRFL